MPRYFRGPDQYKWALLDDGAAVVRTDFLHLVQLAGDRLHDPRIPDGRTEASQLDDLQLCELVSTWGAAGVVCELAHAQVNRWEGCASTIIVGLDRARFGQLLSVGRVSLMDGPILGSPVRVVVRGELVALVAPLGDTWRDDAPAAS